MRSGRAENVRLSAFFFLCGRQRKREETTLFASVRDSLNKHIIADETRFVKFLRKRAHIGT